MAFMNEVDTTKFGWADYGVFVLMLLGSTGIGVYHGFKAKAAKTTREFLTANRTLHWFPVSMSLMASFQSSVTILGYPAEMYLRGTQFWFVIISALMAAAAAAELYLPVYYDLQFSSVNQYLKMRFKSERLRLLSSFTFLMATVPYMGVVLYGPSIALSSVTPLDTSYSIWIIGIICTFYTSIGGIHAVVWTDVLQVVLMYAGLIAVIVRGFSLVGGVEEAFRIANEGGRLQFFNAGIDPYSTSNLWNAVLGMGIMWCGNYCVTQTEVARYCNVTSKKKSRLALYVNFIGVASIISCACLSGIVLYAFYAKCDPLSRGVITSSDQLMPYFVMETLSDYPGVAGLFVCCVFSASLSTLSSGFNALAAVTWDDFLSRTRLGNLEEKHIKIVSKITAAVYGLLSIGMAFFAGLIGSVLKAAISLAGALIGPLFGSYLLGILCPFANEKGVTIGLLLGEAFGLWVLAGSIMHPAPKEQLPTSVSQCFANGTIPTLTIDPIVESVEDNPLLRLYHIAFLLVPVSGFLLSFITGMVCSYIFDGKKAVEKVDPQHLNPIAWYLWPKSLTPVTRRDDRFSLRHQLKDDSESIEFNSLKAEMKNGSAINYKLDSHGNPTLLLKELQSSNNSIEKN